MCIFSTYVVEDGLCNAVEKQSSAYAAGKQHWKPMNSVQDDDVPKKLLTQFRGVFWETRFSGQSGPMWSKVAQIGPNGHRSPGWPKVVQNLVYKQFSILFTTYWDPLIVYGFQLQFTEKGTMRHRCTRECCPQVQVEHSHTCCTGK